VARNLLTLGGSTALTSRVLVLNVSSDTVLAIKSESQPGLRPHMYSEGSRVNAVEMPWLPLRTADLHFMKPNAALGNHKGRWTMPYYSCRIQRWVMSYTVAVQPKTKKLVFVPLAKKK
jgi:hypothetical protein